MPRTVPCPKSLAGHPDSSPARQLDSRSAPSYPARRASAPLRYATAAMRRAHPVRLPTGESGASWGRRPHAGTLAPARLRRFAAGKACTHRGCGVTRTYWCVLNERADFLDISSTISCDTGDNNSASVIASAVRRSNLPRLSGKLPGNQRLLRQPHTTRFPRTDGQTVANQKYKVRRHHATSKTG
jgi:hypothetical protein